MNRIFLSICLISLLGLSCVKTDQECSATDSTVSASTSERANVKNFLTANNIIATEHSSGFFYNSSTPGTGTSLSNLCSEISVEYQGSLTNGSQFDASQTGRPVTLVLSQVIAGWQKGIPLIQSGGIINLYIPPSLGYGSREIRDPQTNALLIPANSILIFHIELKSVRNF